MRLKEVTYCGAMVAVIALLGIIPPFPLPGLPVPISLQTTGIMLAGSLLGKKLGTISVLIFFTNGFPRVAAIDGLSRRFCGFSWTDGWLFV